MAIIRGGSPMGEIRGKLGASVYSRNKAGQIVRSYVIPTDPRTQAQQRARIQFGQSASAFHTLEANLKAGWNTFASTYFASKRLGNTSGAHSGVNAFVSLRNTLLQMFSLQNLPIVKINGVAATGVTQRDLFLPGTPPLHNLQGVLDEGRYTIGNTTNLQYYASTNTIKFQFNTIPSGSGGTGVGPTPSTGSILRDGAGLDVGFLFYLSNPMVQPGVFVNNPDLICIGSTGLINSYTLAVAAETETVYLEVGSNYDVVSGKTIIQASQYSEISVWMVNQLGMSIKIASNIDLIA